MVVWIKEIADYFRRRAATISEAIVKVKDHLENDKALEKTVSSMRMKLIEGRKRKYRISDAWPRIIFIGPDLNRHGGDHRGFLSQFLLNSDSLPFSSTLTSGTYNGQVGITWVILDYFRLRRSHFSYTIKPLVLMIPDPREQSEGWSENRGWSRVDVSPLKKESNLFGSKHRRSSSRFYLQVNKYFLKP